MPMDWKNAVLSPRQWQVLHAYWSGESLADTAKRMQVSIKAVSLYRKDMRQKLRAHTMIAAVKAGLKQGLLK